MRFIVKKSNIVVATDKRWLTRHGYSKLAIKAYGYLLRASDVSDEAIADKCKVSLRSYQEAKRELVYSGLLEIHKLNADTLLYLIGDKAIEQGIKGLRDKEYSRLIRKSLESLELCREEVEEDTTTTALYTAEDLEKLKAKIPLPSPIEIS